MDFRLWWAIAAAALIVLVLLLGRHLVTLGAGSGRLYAILIDDRERFSLNRLQLVMWTILIVSTFLGLVFANLADPSRAMSIPTELLGLLGISVGTAVAAGAVKEGKNTLRAEKIGGGPTFVSQLPGKALAAHVQSETPHLGQIVLEEEGRGANRIVSITKFQNLIFTGAVAIVYVVLTWKAKGYPILDEKTIWLIGVSHAGYVGGKIPDKD